MMPFNAMLAFAIILGVGSLMISVSDVIRTERRKRASLAQSLHQRACE